MKRPLLLFLSFVTIYCSAQREGSSSSGITELKLYSEDSSHYFITRSWTNVGDHDYGETKVYRSSDDKELYRLDRCMGFGGDCDEEELALSNDGKVICRKNRIYAGRRDTNKVVLQFFIRENKGAQLTRFFTAKELGLHLDKKITFITYQNRSIHDYDKPALPGNRYAYKDSVPPEQVFYTEHPLFSKGDSLYLITGDEELLVFHFTGARLVRRQPAIAFYKRPLFSPQLPKFSKRSINAPSQHKLPGFDHNEPAGNAMAKKLGVETSSIFTDKNHQEYKLYRLKLKGLLDSTGKFSVISMERDEKLDSAGIIAFFQQYRFDASELKKKKLPYWYAEPYVYFRNASKSKAREERLAQWEKEKKENTLRLTADSINHVYIPRDMSDCFRELDRLLDVDTKAEIKAMAKPSDMIKYHMGLGMWMRNNWGLWRGSRLSKYMRSRGGRHPDDMSSEILEEYWKHAHGDEEAGKNWEEAHPVKEAGK